MEERLQAKVDEVIETILEKDPKNITRDEYLILDMKLYQIRQERKDAEAHVKAVEALSALSSSSPYPLNPASY